MQRRLGQHVAGNGAGEQQEPENQRELHRHDGESRLQYETEQHQAGATGVGDAGRVQARVKIRKAQHADAAGDDQEAARHQRHPADDFDNGAHGASSRGRAAPRSPYSKYLSTAMVPAKLMSA